MHIFIVTSNDDVVKLLDAYHIPCKYISDDIPIQIKSFKKYPLKVICDNKPLTRLKCSYRPPSAGLYWSNSKPTNRTAALVMINDVDVCDQIHQSIVNETCDRDIIYTSRYNINNSKLISIPYLINRVNDTCLSLPRRATVAVVGNSPIIIDQKLGHTIDQHEVVVRFNLGGVKEFHDKEYFGSKTTIRILNGRISNMIIHDRLPLHEVKAIAHSDMLVISNQTNAGLVRDKLLTFNIQVPTIYSKKFTIGKLLSILRAEGITTYYKHPTLNINPTSGMIYILVMLTYFKTISLYGIDVTANPGSYDSIATPLKNKITSSKRAFGTVTDYINSGSTSKVEISSHDHDIMVKLQDAGRLVIYPR